MLEPRTRAVLVRVGLEVGVRARIRIKVRVRVRVGVRVGVRVRDRARVRGRVRVRVRVRVSPGGAATCCAKGLLAAHRPPKSFSCELSRSFACESNSGRVRVRLS